jgi:hypothetical protein
VEVTSAIDLPFASPCSTGVEFRLVSGAGAGSRRALKLLSTKAAAMLLPGRPVQHQAARRGMYEPPDLLPGKHDASRTALSTQPLPTQPPLQLCPVLTCWMLPPWRSSSFFQLSAAWYACTLL